MLLGVIRALACNQPECGPLPRDLLMCAPAGVAVPAPSRHGPYASENKIHLPRSPGKRTFVLRIRGVERPIRAALDGLRVP